MGRWQECCRSWREPADDQQTLLCAFLSGATLRKEKPLQEVLSKGQKKSLLKGAGLHFTHIVSGAFLASSFPRSLTSQPAWSREISSRVKSLGCTWERSPFTGRIWKTLKSSLFPHAVPHCLISRTPCWVKPRRSTESWQHPSYTHTHTHFLTLPHNTT